jgi:hypothetical protein
MTYDTRLALTGKDGDERFPPSSMAPSRSAEPLKIPLRTSEVGACRPDRGQEMPLRLCQWSEARNLQVQGRDAVAYRLDPIIAETRHPSASNTLNPTALSISVTFPPIDG